MPTLAIVTHQTLLDPSMGLSIKDQDGHTILSLMRQKGIDGQAVAWDDSKVDWSGFDSAVISSTWNYQDKPIAFRRWVQMMGQSQCKLFNTPELVLWNMHKSYLFDLVNQGIRIPETYLLREHDALDQNIWNLRFNGQKWVMKPAVSASAQGATIVEDLGTAQAYSQQGDVILQFFLSSIREHGEISLVFIDGKYMHAKIKFPARGDFRVQQEFGGRSEDYHPEWEELSFALSVLKASSNLVGLSVYARVDFCRDPAGHLVLMELELIEPELWLASSTRAVSHLVDIVVGSN